ncbi:MAG: dockerin type I domain-containing protein [Candidatus Zixiibacteriota bacterium]
MTIISIFFVFWAATIYATEPTAYVLNTNGETVSKIDINTGTVINDIFLVGSTDQCYPNQMIIRDTLMYITVSGTDEIQIVNLNDEKTSGFIDLPDWSNPYWTDFINNQSLYVSLLLNDAVARIDLTTGTITEQIAVGKSPEGVSVYGDRAYVACTGFDFSTYLYDPGKVYVIDITADTILSQIAVGLNPQYLAFDAIGRIHVVCTGDYFSTFGAIYIIDPVGRTVIDSVVIGGTPGQISIGPDNVAYIAAAGFSEDGYVYSYNSLTGEIYHSASNPIVVDLNCLTVQAFQDSLIYTGSFTDYVNLIDSSGANQNSFAVGDGPQHIAFNYLPGDANGDFIVNILDVTHLINWLYKGGSSPRWPRWRADADGNRQFNILDITYLIKYLYKDGDRPIVSQLWL